VVLCFDIKLRKNLKEEFAFWDKNPDTLKKLLIALEENFMRNWELYRRKWVGRIGTFSASLGIS
jgi:hypothetical protein